MSTFFNKRLPNFELYKRTDVDEGWTMEMARCWQLDLVGAMGVVEGTASGMGFWSPSQSV